MTKGHTLTTADIADVMSHAGIGQLKGAEEVDTVRHSGVSNIIKTTLAYVDRLLRTDRCSRAAVTLLKGKKGRTLRNTHYTFL
jgi:hypothetical protein